MEKDRNEGKQIDVQSMFGKVVEMVMDDGIEEIERNLGDFNFFDVMGISRMEIRHSNALAWLLSPSRSHGLGTSILKALARRCYDISKSSCKDNALEAILRENYENITVLREWRHIDIVAEGEHLCFAIENKIDSGEHGNQLGRYYDEIITKKKVPLFFLLSPDGREAEHENDANVWTPISYGELYEMISNSFRRESMSEREKIFIENYLELIRREFMESKTEKELKLEEIAKTFYAAHTEALQYLFSLIPDDIVSVTDFIREWLKTFSETNKELRLNPRANENTKGYVRFTTEKMDRYVSSITCPGDYKGAWGDGALYYYEIHIQNNDQDEIEVIFQLAFGCDKKNDEIRKELNKLGMSINSKKSFKDSWVWRTIWASSNVKGQEEAGKKLVYPTLDALIDGEEVFKKKLEERVNYLLKQTEDKLDSCIKKGGEEKGQGGTNENLDSSSR